MKDNHLNSIIRDFKSSFERAMIQGRIDAENRRKERDQRILDRMMRKSYFRKKYARLAASS